jgi:FMN phosphatase YigB (HAD superfamily)
VFLIVSTGIKNHARLISGWPPFTDKGNGGTSTMTEQHLDDAGVRPRSHLTTCSFDVFDTFILRACTTSEGVFARAFELSAASRLHPKAGVNFVQHRIQAEARARKLKKEKSGSYEVTIDEIYACFPFRLFGLERSALPELAEAEFQAELDLCRVNGEILQLYRDSQRDGLRVGFISDTYWSKHQLTTLLRRRHPDLHWDFLYASCEHGTGKSDKLFARYLTEQRVHASCALHIGDNPHADIKSARRHGIRTRFYPQAGETLSGRMQRENSVFELLCPNEPSHLDRGYRTLRRMVATQAAEKSPAFHLGVTVLGPAMAAFDAFVEARVARLRQDGAKVAVAFLGRDGFLPQRVWHELHPQDPASYLEVSRRAAMIGAGRIAELFESEADAELNAATFASMVKILPPAVARFFERFPGGIATARQLIDALRGPINDEQIGRVVTTMRASLLAHLRHHIADLDDCTDLVVVDIGYSGSVQKALRRVFELEQINIRLHGAYLLSMDDDYHDLAPDDTAEGFISDLIVSPHLKKMLTRNAALLEQMCCSAEGSAREYHDGNVIREPDRRLPEQLALIAEIQSGAMAFVHQARDIAERHLLQPFAEREVAARWTAAIVGRLLLLPDDDELTMFGPLQHDVNLGTETLVPLLDGNAIKNLEIARGLPVACTASHPPMWIAGSFASVSPALGYLYLLFGANRLPAHVFADTKCAELQIGLLGADGQATMVTVSCYRTAMGSVRIRIPVSQILGVKLIAVPIAKIALEGILEGVAIQTGKNVQKASVSRDVVELPTGKLATAGLELSGRSYRADGANGCLVIPVETQAPVAIFSIALTPLGGERILSMPETKAIDDNPALASLRRLASPPRH